MMYYNVFVFAVFLVSLHENPFKCHEEVFVFAAYDPT